MRRTVGLVGVSVLLLAAMPAAAAVFSDDFESGVSGSKWQVMPGTYNQILVGDGAHAFGTQSAKQVDADPWVYYMRTNPGVMPTATPIGAGQSEMVTVYMWDDGQFIGGHPSNQPVAGGVMLASTDSSDFFQLNVNSTSATGGGYGYYSWRTSAQGTFSTGVARTQGWHKMQIEVLPYTGSNDVKFYIDNTLVASGNRKPAASGLAFDQIRLGISIKTYAPFWYDNVNVVPEPATLALLALGGLATLRRRTR